MLINCTNHEITVDLDATLLVIPPSGNVARVSLQQCMSAIVDDIPIYDALPSTVIKGLPDPSDDLLYIVSSTVAQHARRPDVVCPNHAPDQCTRDHHGRIISIKSFLRYI